MATIGEQVLTARNQAGLTREQVAEISGLSLGYVNDLENDRYSDLSTGTLKQIRQALPLLDCNAILSADPPAARTTPKRGRGRPPKAATTEAPAKKSPTKKGK